MSARPELSIDLAPDLIVGVTDGEGKWLRTSKSWKSALGWDETDLQTRGIQQLVHQDQRAFLRQLLQKSMPAGSWQQTSLRCADKKGSIHWIRWSVQWTETPGQIYWIGTDITEAKQKEDSAGRFQEALDGVAEGIWEVDAYGHTIYTNPSMAKMLDVSRQLLKQRCIFDYLDQDNGPIAQSFLDGRSEIDQGETELIWQSGTGIPFHTVVTTKQRRDEQGQVTGALLQVSKVLVKQTPEMSFLPIIPGLGDAMLELDHASRLVKEWRRPTAGIAFLPSKVEVGTRLYDFISFDFAQPIEHAIKQALKEKLPISFVYHDKNVADRRFDCRVAPLKNGPHWTQTVLLSIQAVSLFTTGSGSDQETGDSNIYKQILEHIPTAIYVKDIRSDLRFSLFNHEAERLLGLKSSEVINRTDYDVFDEDQADYFRNKDNQAVLNPNSVRSDSEFITTSKGQMWIRSQKTVLLDAIGKPRYLIGTFSDISKMKALAERAHESEQLYKFLSESIHDGLWEWDLETNRFTCNVRWHEELGYEVGELEGPIQTWFKTIPERDRAALEARLKDHIDHQEPFAETIRCETKSGSSFEAECRFHTLRSDDGKPYRVVACLSRRDQAPVLAAPITAISEVALPTLQVAPHFDLGELSQLMFEEMQDPIEAIRKGAEQLLRSRIHQKLQTDRYKVTAKKIKDAAFQLESFSRGLQALTMLPAGEATEIRLSTVIEDLRLLFAKVCEKRQISFDWKIEDKAISIYTYVPLFLELLISVEHYLLEQLPQEKDLKIEALVSSQAQGVCLQFNGPLPELNEVFVRTLKDKFSLLGLHASLSKGQLLLEIPYNALQDKREASPA